MPPFLPAAMSPAMSPGAIEGATPVGATPVGAAPAGVASSRPGPRDDADAKRPRFLRRRRAETLSGLLPLAAFFALMPPFVRIFAHDGRIFGAPSALVFLLGLWLGLVIAARMLSRRLLNPDRDL